MCEVTIRLGVLGKEGDLVYVMTVGDTVEELSDEGSPERRPSP